MKPALTIKLGGSLLYDNTTQLRTHIINEFSKVVEELVKNFRLYIVTGGGKVTRMYTTMLDGVLNNSELDQVAIELSRIHALIVAKILRPLSPRLVRNYEELLYSSDNSVTVCGGFYPGQSTNGTAALIAEITNSSLMVNLLSYDGVAAKDPVKYGKSSILARVTYEEMEVLINNFKQEPGHYELFDHTALRIVSRSKIPVRFINGNFMENLTELMNGGDIGTLLHPGY